MKADINEVEGTRGNPEDGAMEILRETSELKKMTVECSKQSTKEEECH